MVITDNKTVLYVSGFSSTLRARDLAYEFERYGRLVRCDIPALKTPMSTPFAFVEFRRGDDAEDAYYDMHGRAIEGRRITVQWAKRPPSTAWRHDGGAMGSERGPRPYGRDDRGRMDDPRGRYPGDRSPRRDSPPRRAYDDRRPDRDYRDAQDARDDRDARDARGDRGRDHSRSPRDERTRDRSLSPAPRRGDNDRDDREPRRADSPKVDSAGDIRLRSQSPARASRDVTANAEDNRMDTRD